MSKEIELLDEKIAIIKEILADCMAKETINPFEIADNELEVAQLRGALRGLKKSKTLLEEKERKDIMEKENEFFNSHYVHRSEKIKIMYHDPDMPKLDYVDGKSDWIDLRAAETVEMKAGEFKLISLGISVQIPHGYELIAAPRSSTFKNFGILQTNSVGVIDESYCGSDDIIKFPALAMRDTVIHKGDRICQCRLLEHQPHITFEEVNNLDENTSRGGFGSTGVQ